MANKVGRPTTYSVELTTIICERIAKGESMKKVCEDPKMPTRPTVQHWLLDPEKKEFLTKYKEAIEIRTENMFDELTEIADDGRNDYMERVNADGDVDMVLNKEHIQRSRLRTDVRKWYLSKIMPKKFGDKVDLTSGDKPIQGNVIVVKSFAKEEEDNGADS